MGAPIGCVSSGLSCPTHSASGEVRCSLDSSNTSNFIEDIRLEFAGANDLAIAYTAPEAGSYLFSLEERPSPGCGISIQDSRSMRHRPSDCPAEGETTSLDGVFVEETMPFELSAGETVLVVLGCPLFASPAQGRFDLVIDQSD